ncbi:MAG: hypothetical protein J6W60_07535 [Treponema sp.]|nr:hypothetical protein [Treponema sp.]MBP5752690.1 hypothetical protein [Treponema sp.]
MKFSKKGVAVFAAALALSASVAFADVSFTNTVSTGIIEIIPGVSPMIDFAGVSEKIEAEYTSEKFDFGAQAELTLDNQPGFQLVYSQADSTWDFMDLKWTDLDFYLEFRPWSWLTFFLSDEIYTPGSYLPVVGFNMGSGNLGSDIGVMWKPFNGLRATIGLDVISYFGGDPSTDKDVWIGSYITDSLPKINIGADYTYKNMWSVGLVGRDILNWGTPKSASIGLFGSFTGIEGWAFYSGLMFNHNYDWKWDVNDQYPNANVIGFIGEYRVEGLLLFDIGLSAWNDKISVDFDLSTNFGMNRAPEWDYRWYSLFGAKDNPFPTDSASYQGVDYTDKYNRANQYRHYYEAYDFYAGLRGKYQFSKSFSTDITLKGVADFEPRLSTTSEDTASATDNNWDAVNPNIYGGKYNGRGVVFETLPTVQYHVGKHTFSFGVDLVFADPFVQITFPTSWTYRF